jgi:hypothetical protein
LISSSTSTSICIFILSLSPSTSTPNQASKKPIVILKLDFAKAFDTVEHGALLQVMRHKGLNKRWLDWAASILSMGTSLVLLNGILGK